MSVLARIQTGALFTVAKFLKLRVPETIAGAGSRAKVGAWCAEHGYANALVVTDASVIRLKIADKLFASLRKADVAYAIYDRVLPSPTVGMATQAAALGKSTGAQVVVAIGGGSVIDCAKLAAAAMTSSRKPKSPVGTLMVWRDPLPIVAIPTTAGTGSEVSVGAVISDDVTHKKSIMIAPRIVPVLAVLDGETMQGLPPQWTAGTVFDALTHACEAYISRHYDAGAE